MQTASTAKISSIFSIGYGYLLTCVLVAFFHAYQAHDGFIKRSNRLQRSPILDIRAAHSQLNHASSIDVSGDEGELESLFLMQRTLFMLLVLSTHSNCTVSDTSGSAHLPYIAGS